MGCWFVVSKTPISQRRVGPEEVSSLRRRVEAYQTDRGLGVSDLVNQRKMQRSNRGDSKLWYELSIYGQELTGKRDCGAALRHLGFSTRVYGSFEDVAKMVRPTITWEFVDDLYKGVHSPAKLVAKTSRFGKGFVRNALHRRKTDPRLRSIYSLVDSLYPDLAQQYGKTVSELLEEGRLSSDQVVETLEKWFYEGRSLSYSPLGILGLGKEGRFIGNLLLSQRSSRGDFYDLFPSLRVKRKQTYTQSLSACLRIAIPEMRESDLIIEKGATRVNGIIGEREALFMLAAISRADPSLRLMGEKFQRFFTKPFKEVYTPHTRKEILVSNGDSRLEADGRIVGEDGDVLVEVKSHNGTRGTRKMIDKYSHATTWNDGTPISAKVAILNLLDPLDGEEAELLAREGWRVLQREEFRDFYRKSLEILAAQEPDFFSRAAVPLSGLEDLLRIDNLAHEQKHVLLRRGHRYLRMWISEMLKANTLDLLSGQRFDLRMPYPQRTVIPFDNLASRYTREIYGSLEGKLFMDLETAGFRNEGAPIVVLGMGYEEDGRLFVEQWLARTPLEEADAIKAYEKRAQHADEEIGFNSQTFDWGFLAERARANLIQQKRRTSLRRLDLITGWRDYAQKRKFPHNRLQDWERIKGGLKREDDLPGSRVPEIYWNYLMGEDEKGEIERVLRHNALDVATLMLMYGDKSLKKVWLNQKNNKI